MCRQHAPVVPAVGIQDSRHLLQQRTSDPSRAGNMAVIVIASNAEQRYSRLQVRNRMISIADECNGKFTFA